MRACISRSEARTAPNIAVPLLGSLLFLAALLLSAPHALGQTARSGKATASRDTTVELTKDDEGFSVRVIEDGKPVDPKTLSPRARAALEKAAEEARKSGARTKASNLPEPPDTPDIPDAPDVGDSNDLVRFGEDVEIPADKVIEGDVVALGGSVTVYGRVKGDCMAIGGTVRVKGDGVVEGDAVSLGGGVFTADSADVRGSNVSIGAWPFREGHGAMLPLLGIFGLSAFAGLVVRVVELMLTIFFAWIALLLFRERMVPAANRMGERFGASFLYGLLGWAGLLVTVPAGVVLMALVGALAIVILCITIIGIPVAILLAVALVLAVIGLVIGVVVLVFIAHVVGAMWLGRRLLGRTRGSAATPLKAAAFGLLLMVGLAIVGKILGFIGLVLLMPVGIGFGILAGMLAVVMTTAGFGSMILTRFGKAPLGAGAAGGYGSAGFASTGPAPPQSPPPPPPPAAPSSTAPPDGGTSDAP